MVEISSEIVGVIYFLMPGFITAWIFYGLTAHRRLSPFERTVQALIFTGIVRFFVLIVGGISQGVNYVTNVSIGQWTENVEYIWSFVIAFLLGHLLAYIANHNLYHSFLAFYEFTQRTSFPSEWFSTFAKFKRYVTLHLDGGRRLFGWPYEWPDRPDVGHFVIQEPTWILDDNTEVPVLGDEFVVVPVTSVELVEILKFREQTADQTEKIKSATDILIDLQKGIIEKGGVPQVEGE